jgi:5-methylthioadenosine/S-adenosylhomocysteine deaminase
MKLLIKNAHILTMTSCNDKPFIGDIGIENDTIKYIGVVPDHFVPEKILDGSNHVAMPGLINAHTHMGMSLFRNYADDMPLMAWLSEKIWPTEANLTAEDVYYGTMLSQAELIRCGCTTFRDMYYFMDDVAKATALSGLRANLGLGLVGVSDPEGALFETVRALHKKWHEGAEGRIRIEVAPHAPYTCSEDYLKQATELALELDTTLHIHLSESRFEVAQSLENLGKTPIEHCRDLGLFRAKSSAAHCVHLESHDFDILKEKNVSVLYNPSSNLKLGNGFAKIHKMVSEGINVAIGTDGASSNNNLNMFEELHLGALVNKGVEGDPTVLPAYKMLEIGTIGGAKALGIDHIVGTLEIGKKADIILVDLEKAHLAPHHDLVAMLVYSAAGSDVRHVLCNGQILLENYEIVTFDESEIIQKTKTLAKQLIERTAL